MAGVSVDVGTGSSIAFATSAYAANLLSLDYTGPSVETPDSSHMGTADSSPAAGEFANRTKISGNLIEGGEFTAVFQFNPNDVIPVVGSSEVVTVTFPLPAGDATPANWAFPGIVTAYPPTIPLDDIMTVAVVIMVAGAVTKTDSTT